MRHQLHACSWRAAQACEAWISNGSSDLTRHLLVHRQTLYIDFYVIWSQLPNNRAECPGSAKFSVVSRAQLKEAMRIERRRWRRSSGALALPGRPEIVIIGSAWTIVAPRRLTLHGNATVKSASRFVVEAPAVKVPPTAPPPAPMTAQQHDTLASAANCLWHPRFPQQERHAFHQADGCAPTMRSISCR